MKLDTATIVFISVLVDVALLFILVHTWRTRTTYPGFITWVAGTACWSIGSTLVMLLPALHPLFIPKIFGNALVMLHPLLLHEGLNQFHGIRRRWWGTPLSGAVVLAGCLNQLYFLYVAENLNARSIGISLVMAILFGRTALEPLLHVSNRRYSMQWLLSACLLPLITLMFWRAWILLSGAPLLTFADVLTNDDLLRWIIFYGIIVEIIIAYSYLSMTSDRVEEELRKSEESYRSLSSSLKELVEEETKRRLAQERLLANQSRLAAMGEMINAIAHQWRQPLATLGMMIQRTHAVATTQGLSAAYLDEFKANAMRQIKYMSDTIEEFRSFYRPEKQQEPFAIFACISSSITLFDHQFHHNDIVVDVHNEVGRDQLVNGFPNELKQVILNLLSNARDAIIDCSRASGQAGEGRIRVQIAAGAEDSIVIDISDNGCGIPTEIAPRIFDPYFTTKEESGGTGIGLYMSRMLVEGSFGGRLRLLESREGTTFRIELPTGLK